MIHLRLVNGNLHEARADFEKLKSHIDNIVDDSQYYIDVFIDLKNKNKILGSARDIYFWIKKPAQDFIDFIDEKVSSTSKSEVKKNLKLAGAKFICENDTWTIYSITSHDACRYYGRNTKWCITDQSEYYWRKYLLQGYRFYIAINNVSTEGLFSKVAIQCKGNKIYKLWDSLDNSYDLKDLDFLNLPDLTDEIRSSNKDKQISPGLTQTAQCILKVSKRKLSDNITIPNNIAGIPDQSFSESSIRKVVFEDYSQLKVLSNGMFYDCDNLNSVKLPEGLIKLGNGVFHSCENLVNVELPSTLKEIGPYCFKYCSELKELIIPKSVQNIYEGAFANCTSLNSIRLMSKDTYIDPSALEHSPNASITYK